MSTVGVRVPASSANLGPGFDVLAAALDLHLTVEVVSGDPGADPVVDPGGERLPRDRTNLVVRSFETLMSADGLEFRIRGEIPSSRGLGSSAAAIVGGLAAAQAFTGEPLDREILYRRAVDIEGHPDNVGAAIYGGFVACPAGVAGGLPARIAAPEGLAAVVVIPDAPVSTAAARAALPESVSPADAVFNIAATAQLVLGLERSDLSLVASGLGDRLHQPFRASLFAEASALIESATSLGALGATVSGAGPSILFWCDSDRAEGLTSRLAEMVDGWASALEVPFSATGVEVVEPPGD